MRVSGENGLAGARFVPVATQLLLPFSFSLLARRKAFLHHRGRQEEP